MATVLTKPLQMSCSDAMRGLRIWLDYKKLHPTSFRITTEGGRISFEIEFPTDRDVAAFGPFAWPDDQAAARMALRPHFSQIVPFHLGRADLSSEGRAGRRELVAEGQLLRNVVGALRRVLAEHPDGCLEAALWQGVKACFVPRVIFDMAVDIMVYAGLARRAFGRLRLPRGQG